MAIGGAFVELGRYLDECERRDSTITDVTLVECDGDDADGSLEANIDVRLSTRSPERPDGGLSVRDPHVGPDGNLRFALESTESVFPQTQNTVDVTPTDPTLERDGSVTMTLSITVPAVDGSYDPNDAERVDGARASSQRPPSDPPSGNESATVETKPSPPASSDTETTVPPFKNPDLLSDIYDSCETFAEMADELDMDVTAETVRRYMIDFDIHQPKSYATEDDQSDTDELDDESTATEQPLENASDVEAGPTETPDDTDQAATVAKAEPEKPVVLSDGIGLPDDVTIETLIETVKRSNTIYEVEREIGVGREDALTMLQDLNLLDLVTGRLATEAERDISRGEIVDRLREASETR